MKCIIFAGRVCGFVECSDLAALLVHMESQKSSCKCSFKLSERTVRDERQSQKVSKNAGDSYWRLASLNVADIAWPLKLAM